MKKLDFEKLASTLLARSREVLPAWLPGGRMVGNEYTCGSLRGEAGDSCKVNVLTGLWADFASGDQGGDLTSLYAKIHGIDQGKAAKMLAEEMSISISTAPKLEPPLNFEIPPKGSPVPSMKHDRFGEPTAKWTYRDADGRVLFFICRYDPDGKKQFVPWTYNSLHKWQKKAWPSPRPLYGLEQLAKYPNRAVLLVEGEKACDAARTLVGDAYVVLTWSGGAKAWEKSDFSVLRGRKVLLWPDADQPGREAMAAVIQAIYKLCPEIKAIHVQEKPEGWDAADAVFDGMDKPAFFAWAKANVRQSKPPLQPVVLDENPIQKVERITPNDLPTIKVQLDNEIEISGSVAAIFEMVGVRTQKNGQPIANANSCLRIFAGLAQFKDLVWYDEFHFKFFTRWRTGKVREWSEADDIAMMVVMQSELEMDRVNEKMVSQAIVTYAMRNVKNEPKDYMESLVWDGTARIDSFFTESFGAPSNEYVRAVSKNFWIAMAARILSPGCKFDNMVIFEGKQGKLKSTALKEIGSPWYVEANESIMTKDFYLQLHGRLIVEIAELDSFSRAEVNTIKKVISTANDRFRPPYGRNVREFPRMSIFCGTTNDDEYLRDATGARRFWPVRIGTIDLDRIKREREQLFAEAVVRFKQGETWWQVPNELAEAEQEQRRQSDSWEDIVLNWMTGRPSCTIQEIWVHALEGDLSRLDRMTQLRIGKILRYLGYASKVTKIGQKTEKRWFRLDIEAVAEEARAVHPLKKLWNAAPGADNSGFAT